MLPSTLGESTASAAVRVGEPGCANAPTETTSATSATAATIEAQRTTPLRPRGAVLRRRPSTFLPRVETAKNIHRSREIPNLATGSEGARFDRDARSHHRYVDAVAIADLADDAGGHACRDDAGGEVARHHSSCADNRVVADRDVRADDHATAEPDVVANADRLARFPPDPPRPGIYRMRRREQLDARRELTCGADRDRRAVEHEAVVVHERPGADGHTRAVFAAKRRPDEDAVAEVADQLVKDRVAHVLVGVQRAVVAVEELLCAGEIRGEIRVVGDVQLA